MHKGSSVELSVVSLRGSKEDKEKKKAKMRKKKIRLIPVLMTWALRRLT